MSNLAKRTERHRKKARPGALAESPAARLFDDLRVAIIEDISDQAVPRAPAIRAMPGSLAALSELGYSDEEINTLVVPRRTRARRQAQNEPLSVEETDRALRLERIASLATRTFGQGDKAQRWLRKPKRQLEGETPLAFLKSETGARIVEDMLHRIEHGILA